MSGITLPGVPSSSNDSPPATPRGTPVRGVEYNPSSVRETIHQLTVKLRDEASPGKRGEIEAAIRVLRELHPETPNLRRIAPMMKLAQEEGRRAAEKKAFFRKCFSCCFRNQGIPHSPEAENFDIVPS